VRYALIGPGAVGLLYAGRLAAAGNEVHIVGRSDVEHLRAHGFVLESTFGDVRMAVPAYREPAEVPPVDVVLVATKTTTNSSLPALLAPLIGDGTIVVLLQNGLDVEVPVAAAFPNAHVLGGLCFVCAVKVGPGHARHVDYGTVTLAEHGARDITPAAKAVAADLEAGGVPVECAPDLRAARWRKLVWNVPYNGLSVVLDAGTDDLNATPSTRALVTDLMLEVGVGAAACGTPLPDGFVERMLATTDEMVPYRTSMKLDFESGRPLELDAIYAAPLRAARAGGVELPRVETLWRQLDYLERARNQSRNTRR
jgi:2-dehydropantoate 2-reductase